MLENNINDIHHNLEMMGGGIDQGLDNYSLCLILTPT